MKKKILSLVLAICMVLCLAPASVLADDTSAAVPFDASKYVQNGELLPGNYYLTSNIKRSISHFEINGDVTLDLNGYGIDIGYYSFTINKSGSLLLKDSRGGGYVENPNKGVAMGSCIIFGTLTVDDIIVQKSNFGDFITIYEPGKFIMNGGSIINNTADSIVEMWGGTFIMNGGEIAGNKNKKMNLSELKSTVAISISTEVILMYLCRVRQCCGTKQIKPILSTRLTV